MIDQTLGNTIASIAQDPKLSHPEKMEELARLDIPIEDSMFWITYNLGDDKFRQIIGRHRGHPKKS